MAALFTDVVLIAENVSKDVDAEVTSTAGDSKVEAFEAMTIGVEDSKVAAFKAVTSGVEDFKVATFKAAAFAAEQAPAAAMVAFMAEEDSMVAAEALMVAAAGKV